MEYGVYTNLSNKEYHSIPDFRSSSQLKMILDSAELFYKTYILGEHKQEHKDEFDVGTAIHMRILEPEEYIKKVTFFDGTRRGKVWDDFKNENKGKIILGNMQKLQVDLMYDSFIKSELGPSLLSKGMAEYSLMVNLEGTNIKVRADFLDGENKRVFDLKSTTGIITQDKFQKMVESKFLGYDLQAALYADAYSTHFGETFEFYWIVMSKDFDDIKFFKASPALLEQGRQKYKQAIKLFNKYQAEGWNFKNTIIELQPSNLAIGEW